MKIIQLIIILCVTIFKIILGNNYPLDSQLYYKVTTGEVYGPYHSQQVLDWFQQGYFNNDLLVSDSNVGNSFIPIESYIAFRSNSIASNYLYSNNNQEQRSHKKSIKPFSILSSLTKKASNVIKSKTQELLEKSKLVSTTGNMKISNYQKQTLIKTLEENNLEKGIDKSEATALNKLSSEYLDEWDESNIINNDYNAVFNNNSLKTFDNISNTTIDSSYEKIYKLDLNDSSYEYTSIVSNPISNTSYNKQIQSSLTTTTPSTNNDKHNMKNQDKSLKSNYLKSSSSSISNKKITSNNNNKISVKSIGKSDYSLWDNYELDNSNKYSNDKYLNKFFINKLKFIKFNNIFQSINKKDIYNKQSFKYENIKNYNNHNNNNINKTKYIINNSKEKNINMFNKLWLNIILIPTNLILFILNIIIPLPIKQSFKYLYLFFYSNNNQLSLELNGYQKLIFIVILTIVSILYFINMNLILITLPSIITLIDEFNKIFQLTDKSVILDILTIHKYPNIWTIEPITNLNNYNQIIINNVDTSNISNNSEQDQYLFQNNYLKFNELWKVISNLLLNIKQLQLKHIELYINKIVKKINTISFQNINIDRNQIYESMYVYMIQLKTFILTYWNNFQIEMNKNPMLLSLSILLSIIITLQYILIPYFLSYITTIPIKITKVIPNKHQKHTYSHQNNNINNNNINNNNNKEVENKIEILRSINPYIIHITQVVYYFNTWFTTSCFLAITYNTIKADAMNILQSKYTIRYIDKIFIPIFSVLLIAFIDCYYRYRITLPNVSRSSSSIKSNQNKENLNILQIKLCEERVSYLSSLLQNQRLYKECKRWNLDNYIHKWLEYEQNQLIQLQTTTTTNNNNNNNNSNKQVNRFIRINQSITSIFKYSTLSYSLLMITIYTLSQTYNDLKIYPLKENLSEIIINIILNINQYIEKSTKQNNTIVIIINQIIVYLIEYLLIYPQKLLRLLIEKIILYCTNKNQIALLPNYQTIPRVILQIKNSYLLTIFIVLLPYFLWQFHISSMNKIDLCMDYIKNEDDLINDIIIRLSSSNSINKNNYLYLHSMNQLKTIDNTNIDNIDGKKDNMSNIDINKGIIFNSITASKSGKVILQDINLSFLPGTINVLLNPTSDNTIVSNAILDLIYNNNNINDLKSTTSCIEIKSGSISIYNKFISHWNSNILQDHIVYLQENEIELSLQAGVLAGMLPDCPPNDMKISLEVQNITGSLDIFHNLPQGSGTIISLSSNKHSIYPQLNSKQWKSLHLSKALFQSNNNNKDILLYSLPTIYMSEKQEKQFYEYLKSIIKKYPKKIIILTSNHIPSNIRDNINQIIPILKI